jgi:hypothetical protein
MGKQTLLCPRRSDVGQPPARGNRIAGRGSAAQQISGRGAPAAAAADGIIFVGKVFHGVMQGVFIVLVIGAVVMVL